MEERIDVIEEVIGQERTLEDILDHYWKVFKRRWKIALLVMLVTVLVMMVRSYRQVPVFSAHGTLMIDEDNANLLMLPGAYRGYSSWRNEYLNTQIEILKSNSLAREVVEDLNLIKGRVDLDESGNNIRAAAIKGFLGGMSVLPIEDTRLVRVSYVSTDPEYAALAINTLFDNFIRFNLKLKTESTEQASDFLFQSINDLKRNLTQKERELQSYGQQKELFYLSNRDSTVVEKFADFNKAYTNAQIERINKEAAYREIQGKPFEEYASVKENALIQGLKQQYSNLEAEYKKKGQIFRESYPEMQRLKAQLDSLQERINTETRDLADKEQRGARAEYQAALERERSLQELLDKQKSEVVSTNTDAIYYNSLQIEVNNMRSLLDHLVRKQKESLLTSRLEGFQTSNIKIIDRAEVPRAPVSTSKQVVGVKAVFIGLFLGVFLVIALDWLDKSIKTPEEVEQFLGIPALGMVPELGTENGHSYYGYGKKPGETRKKDLDHIELANFMDPESTISESYRNIRTSIMLSTADGPPQVIAMTSSVPREGKSATVVNLAVSFTKLGKRVLIIDGDLRKPMIHKIFNAKNTSGLSSFLVSKEPSDELFTKTRVPNLYIIPSGPIPPNPTEILDSKRMEDLLKKLRQHFDIIFIDAPPMVGIVDPVIIGRMADAMLLVVWWGKTNRKSVAGVKSELLKYRIRLLGTILNKVNLKKGEGYGYGYGYSRYAYEYKSDERRA
jgi:capsular exopolysaccharide synthesis family protein